MHLALLLLMVLFVIIILLLPLLMASVVVAMLVLRAWSSNAATRVRERYRASICAGLCLALASICSICLVVALPPPTMDEEGAGIASGLCNDT